MRLPPSEFDYDPQPADTLIEKDINIYVGLSDMQRKQCCGKILTL